MINAGELKKRITLQQQTKARDTYGAETITWADVATVWAKCEPIESGKISVSEQFLLQQIQSKAKLKITIRYRDNISATMRIKWGKRFLYIDAISNHEEANEALILYCFEDVV